MPKVHDESILTVQLSRSDQWIEGPYFMLMTAHIVSLLRSSLLFGNISSAKGPVIKISMDWLTYQLTGKRKMIANQRYTREFSITKWLFHKHPRET